MGESDIAEVSQLLHEALVGRRPLAAGRAQVARPRPRRPHGLRRLRGPRAVRRPPGRLRPAEPRPRHLGRRGGDPPRPPQARRTRSASTCSPPRCARSAARAAATSTCGCPSPPPTPTPWPRPAACAGAATCTRCAGPFPSTMTIPDVATRPFRPGRRRGGLARGQQPGLRLTSRAGRLDPRHHPRARGRSRGSTPTASSSTSATGAWPRRAGRRCTTTPSRRSGRST